MDNISIYRNYCMHFKTNSSFRNSKMKYCEWLNILEKIDVNQWQSFSKWSFCWLISKNEKCQIPNWYLHMQNMIILMFYVTIWLKNILLFLKCYLCWERDFIECDQHTCATLQWGKPTLLRKNMTSSNGNIFRVTGPLWGECPSHRWSPLTKASEAELWCFLWSTNSWAINRDARYLRRHCAHYNATVMWLPGTRQKWSSTIKLCQRIVRGLLNIVRCLILTLA